MIVPVWVASADASSTEVLTYAVLDTQSDSTLILDEVAQALNMTCQPVHLQLSSMTYSVIKSEAVSDFIIRGLTLLTQISINKAYS